MGWFGAGLGVVFGWFGGGSGVAQKKGNTPRLHSVKISSKSDESTSHKYLFEVASGAPKGIRPSKGAPKGFEAPVWGSERLLRVS